MSGLAGGTSLHQGTWGTGAPLGTWESARAQATWAGWGSCRLQAQSAQVSMMPMQNIVPPARSRD